MASSSAALQPQGGVQTKVYAFVHEAIANPAEYDGPKCPVGLYAGPVAAAPLEGIFGQLKERKQLKDEFEKPEDISCFQLSGADQLSRVTAASPADMAQLHGGQVRVICAKRCKAGEVDLRVFGLAGSSSAPVVPTGEVSRELAAMGVPAATKGRKRQKKEPRPKMPPQWQRLVTVLDPERVFRGKTIDEIQKLVTPCALDAGENERVLNQAVDVVWRLAYGVGARAPRFRSEKVRAYMAIVVQLLANRTEGAGPALAPSIGKAIQALEEDAVKDAKARSVPEPKLAEMRKVVAAATKVGAIWKLVVDQDPSESPFLRLGPEVWQKNMDDFDKACMGVMDRKKASGPRKKNGTAEAEGDDGEDDDEEGESEHDSSADDGRTRGVRKDGHVSMHSVTLA